MRTGIIQSSTWINEVEQHPVTAKGHEHLQEADLVPADPPAADPVVAVPPEDGPVACDTPGDDDPAVLDPAVEGLVVPEL